MALVEVDWRPDRGKLRTFGFVALAAFGALGAWVAWRHSIFGIGLTAEVSSTTARVLWGAGALSGLAAATFPPALKPLYWVLTAVTIPIGLVLSHVILLIAYYLVLTPIGLAMRVVGYDPMTRKIDPDAATYWTPRKPIEDVGRYFRQF